MNEVNFVDQTLRDGHLSLWATGMTTGMILPVASHMDRVGFIAVDVMGALFFKKWIRDLREDPWERIRLLRQRITRTPLATMMQHSLSGFTITPHSIMKLWFERLAANGIKRVHLMEATNDFSFRIPETCRLIWNAGMEVILALTYSVSSKHTDGYYAQRARDAAKLKPDIIFFKDPGGLLTPERARTVIPLILENTKGIRLELHTHCTTGLGALVYLEGIKLGINTIHTAIPPLANGCSNPSVLNIARNARLLGYTPSIDEEAVKPISDHFTYVAKREGLTIGQPVEYDYYQYMHQLPGGMISNLKYQLSQIKMEHRLDEVLEEVVRVRQDLGYPIMVTPFSQFVGTQAVLNTVARERYEQIIDEVILYALGFFGPEAASSVDSNLKDRILSLPRANELAVVMEKPEPSIEEVRQRIGGPLVSDEELLLRYMMGGEEEINAMKAAGPIKEYPSAEIPVVTLIRELVKREKFNYIHIHKGGFSLSLSKKGG